MAVNAPYTQIVEVLRWIDHTPIETESESCVVRIRADKLEWLTMAIVRIALAAPVTVLEPVAVADAIGELVERLTKR